MNQFQSKKINRPHGIGGTDISAVLGLSPYKTPLQLWAEKVSDQGPPQRDAIHLRFGQHLEPFVACEYERVTGLYTSAPVGPVFHPEHGFMFASIDRLVTPEPVADGTVISCGDAERLLECKTSSAFGRQDWGEAGTDQVPTHYLLQCAWYMAVTNCSRTDLAVLIGNSELRIFDIRRDLRLEGLILEQAQRFWYDNVLANEPPAPSNAVDAQILFPIDEPGSRIEADEETLECIERLAAASAQSSQAADEVDELKGLLMARMGRAQEITHAGRVLATWKNTRPARRLDTTALRCAHPEIAEEFTTTGTTCRRFVFRGTP